MDEAFDFSLIDEAIVQAKNMEREYDLSYNEYATATNNTIDILIELAMSDSPKRRQQLANQYRDSMQNLLLTRKKTDRSQFDRVNMQGTMINIVDMMKEEFLVVLRRHERKLRDMNEQVGEMERSIRKLEEDLLEKRQCGQ